MAYADNETMEREWRRPRYSLKIKWHRTPSDVEKAIVKQYFEHDMTANNRKFLLERTAAQIMQTLRNVASFEIVVRETAP
jgi:hypothetical protein